MVIESIITDVTRMRAPNVCIAGTHQDRTIRLHNPQPSEQWLQSIGGLLPGDIVSVDWKPARNYLRPHVEDGEWDESTFSKIGRITGDELAKELSARAFSSVKDAFGSPWLIGKNGNGAFQPGKGSRSLASILAAPTQVYPHFEGIRVDFSDTRNSWAMVPFEDLTVRSHQKLCRSCSSRLSTLLVEEFQGSRAILRVGLARQFQAGGHPSACWLQVNHIFLMPSKRKHFV